MEVMGLNKALLVENRLCGGSRNRLGCAGDIADHAGLYKTGAEARAVLVAGTADDLFVFVVRPRRCATGAVKRADNGLCLYYLSEKFGVKAEKHLPSRATTFSLQRCQIIEADA